MFRFALLLPLTPIVLSGCFIAPATSNVSLIENLRGSTYRDVQERLGDPSDIYLRGPIERCEIALAERRERAEAHGLVAENVEAIARVIRGHRPSEESDIDRDCDQRAQWEIFPSREFDGTEFIAVYFTDSRREVNIPATATTRVIGNTAYTTFNSGYSGEVGGICSVRMLFVDMRLADIRHFGNGCT